MHCAEAEEPLEFVRSLDKTNERTLHSLVATQLAVQLFEDISNVMLSCVKMSLRLSKMLLRLPNIASRWLPGNGKWL